MHTRLASIFALMLLLTTGGCAALRSGADTEMTPARRAVLTAERSASWIDACLQADCGIRLDRASAVDTVRASGADSIIIEMNEAFAQVPFREGSVDTLYAGIRRAAGEALAGRRLQIRALGVDVRTLVPNIYRTTDLDDMRRPSTGRPGRPLVRAMDAPWRTEASLAGRHVAVWPSHGWYYERSLDRWEWQRARLFRTVEDLLPMSFILPYLAPMLERAGAYVHMPRERDTQTEQVIVDNDSAAGDADADSSALPGASIYAESGDWTDGAESGFADRPPYSDGDNPFRLGSYRVARTGDPTVIWSPDIPEYGTYSVSVSWGRADNPTTEAIYEVYHRGGVSTYRIDQSMAAGTWVYLGRFEFEAGVDPERGSVRLARGDTGVLSADAVRFGGGTGSVKRGDRTSGRPRFTEGARYWMQFAGMPAELVYNVTESTNDYIDDYRGRAEWVNYLRGAPYGPNKARDTTGLGVPVDVSLAFHTDAGIAGPDTTIGTLMIYSSEGMDSTRAFPDGMSRFANRDLGDLIQTTIVEDVRALYDSTWARRGIWDRDYSEAVRPNVPAVLLELLSHQNLEDMSYALDPRFRFDASRAIYKAIGRFISSQNGEEFVVQPLPPDHLAADIGSDGSIRVSWRPVEDPLEPSARPTGYVVYHREAGRPYDAGRLVPDTTFTLVDARRSVVHGFRVAAINAGGESQWSEEVAAGLAAVDARPAGAPGRGATALVVAGFDRIAAPERVVQPGFSGFTGFLDEGVPDGADISYVGDQYDFDPDSPWLDDDSPGHGASYSTYETRILTGNTFDYPAVHGAELLRAGWSFSTVSDEVYARGGWSATRYPVVDVILGEEKTTHGPGDRTMFEALPQQVRSTLAAHAEGGGHIMISGAHFATDVAGRTASEEGREFARDVLGLLWRTDHAVQRGEVFLLENPVANVSNGADVDIPAFDAPPVVRFNTDPVAGVYRVESPDAIEPAPGAATLMRYADNNMSAVVGRPAGESGRGAVVAFGFPLETVSDPEMRSTLFRASLEYLYR